MWSWLRLGTARVLLLAALLAVANMAGQRYAQDTQVAVSTPEFSSLGGLRVWRLSFEAPRRTGLLNQFVRPDTRALMRWSSPAEGSNEQPVIWLTSWGVTVQGALERSGNLQGVWVASGLGWPRDGCWAMSQATEGRGEVPGERLTINESVACTALSSPNLQTKDPPNESQLAQAQREIKLLDSRARVVVIGPEMAARALGDDWSQQTSGAWVGVGAMPKSDYKTNTKPNAAQPIALEVLQNSGWTVHAIRHEPSQLLAQVHLARVRWQWGLAMLGFAVGALAAWGYRHVLSLVVAVRRTGGAHWVYKGLDALRLSAAVAALMIGSNAILFSIALACGAQCAWVSPSGWLEAQSAAQRMVWPWAGLAAGLLLCTSFVVWRADRVSLQALFARGGHG